MSTMDDLEDLFDAEDALIANDPPEQNAGDLLPIHLIQSTLPRSVIRQLASAPSTCAIIEAPSEQWVRPLTTAIQTFAKWDYRHFKTTPERSTGYDKSANDHAVVMLARGQRIIAISQDPQNLLPPSMLSAADIVLKIPNPPNAVISSVIKEVTGRTPKGLPANIGTTLSFDELAAGIRSQSTARECVERLLRAVEAKRSQTVNLEAVPHIHELHGYGAAQTWAENLVVDVEAWRRGEVEFSAIERQVVLYSEPGLGKTTFVRSLSKSSGLPLVATSVGQWFASGTGYLDSVIKQINQLFETARNMAPAIVFLDELDAVPNRATLSERNRDWWLPVVTHLLTTLDSAVSDTNNNLVIIGATNFPDALDAALIRPGRLSRMIRIDRPDEAAMNGILRQHLGNDLRDADISVVVQTAVGGTGADVMAWVKSARRAARHAKRPMALADLLNAIVPEDHRPADLVRHIAVHEAGHAVVAHVLDLGSVASLSLVQDSNRGGSTLLMPHKKVPTRGHLENMVLYSLGGRAAEEVVLGTIAGGSGGDANSDIALATRAIGGIHLNLGLGDSLIYRANDDDIPRALAMDRALSAIVDDELQRLYREAVEIARKHRNAIEAIAGELVEHRHIGRERFLEVWDQAQASTNAGVDGRKHNG